MYVQTFPGRVDIQELVYKGKFARASLYSVKSQKRLVGDF